MTSEILYNYVTCFKNAFSTSGDLRLSCVQISLISDTGPILAIREPCPFQSLAIFSACTAQFVSDLFGNHIVGFPMRRLIF